MNLTRSLAILVMLLGLVAIVIGGVFIGQGIAKNNLIVDRMEVEQVTLALDPEKPNVYTTITDIDSTTPVSCNPINLYSAFCFFKVKGTAAVAIVFTTTGIVARYCYLDNGRLKGYYCDMEHYINHDELRYMPEDINSLTPETRQWIIQMLTDVLNDKDPIQDPDNGAVL